MTQALAAQLGGSPFGLYYTPYPSLSPLLPLLTTTITTTTTGPAGTGKTESVKALGNQMGRFVLVFNCDETFDFQV